MYVSVTPPMVVGVVNSGLTIDSNTHVVHDLLLSIVCGHFSD